MADANPIDELNLIEFSGAIVSAYVGHNSVGPADVPKLIVDVHAALSGLVTSAASATLLPPKPTPAVPIRKSITPDFLICLDDGKKFKSLKRHLAQLGMTPDEYRSKWGLPSDYPMVAPNYSATRSALAKRFGLGRKPEPPARKRARAMAKTS